MDTPVGLQGLPRNAGQGSATDQLIQMNSKPVEREKDVTANLG